MKRIKKSICIFFVLVSAFSLCACHETYYNNGSDYAAPGFNQENPTVGDKAYSFDSLTDFEKDFIVNIFGEDYEFTGYDDMSEEDKNKIIEYFKSYNEGYYTVGFENGFFYTFNENEGKETYGIPWGYESLSSHVTAPTVGTCTRTTFSEALGFTAKYETVTYKQTLLYCEELVRSGFALEYEEQNTTAADIYDKQTLNRFYLNGDGYSVNVIFSVSTLTVNITSVKNTSK